MGRFRWAALPRKLLISTLGSGSTFVNGAFVPWSGTPGPAGAFDGFRRRPRGKRAVRVAPGLNLGEDRE